MTSSVSCPRPTSLERPETDIVNLLASIEKLPNDILHPIFLSTCNVSLPLASLPIAKKLSGPYVYRKFLDRIFCDIKSVKNACCTVSCIWQTSLALRGSDEEERSAIRIQALNCRWLTWEIFSQHRKRILDRKYLQRQWFLCNDKRFEGDPEHIRRFSFFSTKSQLHITQEDIIPHRFLDGSLNEASRFEFFRMMIKSGCDISNVSETHDEDIFYRLWYDAVRDRDYRMIHLLTAHVGRYELNFWCKGVWHNEASIILHTMEICDADIVMANLLRCCIFHCSWRRLERARHCDWSHGSTFWPLLETYHRRAAVKINTVDELISRLTEKYPNDEEWLEDVVSTVSIQFPEGDGFCPECGPQMGETLELL